MKDEEEEVEEGERWRKGRGGGRGEVEEGERWRKGRGGGRGEVEEGERWERERETGEMGFLAQVIESQQMYIHTYFILKSTHWLKLVK